MKTLARTATALFFALAAPAMAATPPDTLVIAKNIDDIVSLDPAQAFEFSGGEILNNVYENLVQYEAEDMTRLTGGVAESWTVAPDGKTFVFQLRDGLRFQSGNPVTPDDVVFSLTRVIKLDKAPAFILAQLGWTPENVDEMVRATGEREVTLTIPENYAPSFVLNVLAARPGAIVDRKTVLEHEQDGDLGNAWLTDNSAGSGPFSLQSWRPSEMVVLQANPNYRRGAPPMDRVIIRHVAESATQRLLLEAGDVDMARDLTPDQIAAIEGNEDIRVETFPQAAVHFISLNQKHEKLQNPALWKAMRYLVDYEGMADTILRGQMRIHQAFWPAGFPGAVTDTPYSYDPDEAKQILEEAGLTDRLSVTMDVISSSPFTDMAQSIQATFAEAGIDVELLPGTGSQVITKYRARNHEMMLIYWSPDFMDPHANAKAFAYNVDNSDDHPQSTGTWRNSWLVPELSAQTQAALTEEDADKRLAMYEAIQEEVMEASPFIIMFQAISQVAMRQGVEGYAHGSAPDFVYFDRVTKQ